MKYIISKDYRWGVLWKSHNLLDGFRQHLMRGKDCNPILFRTRYEARQYIENTYGYLRNRKDLKEHPHGWKMPKVVKVEIDYSMNATYTKSQIAGKH